MLRYFVQLLLLPFRIVAYAVIHLRSLHRPLIFDLAIRADYSEAPLSHGLWSYFKPAKDRFYLLALELNNILDALKTKNLKLRRLRIVFENHNLGWAQAWELRSLLKQFNEHSVETFAYLLSDDKISLFIASGCQKIISPESATFDLTPFTSESFYLQSFLTKIGIRPQFMSVGEFKSAAEIFTRKSMSPAARKQSEELIADLENSFFAGIAEKSNVYLNKKNRTLIGTTAAVRSNLIDQILSHSEFIAMTEDKVNLREIDLASIDKLLRRQKFKLFNFKKPRRIALVVAEGNIIESANSRPGTINWPDFADVTHAISEGSYDGCLLRINSPGGSALVSQLLWREWMQASGRQTSVVESTNDKKTNKSKAIEELPIVVSQGNVAASGGYYLSAVGNTIFATPMTITGSIGVVGGKFNVAPLLKRLGVDIDKAPRKNSSPAFSPFADFDKAQSKLIRENMLEIYDQFLRDVAEGRKQKKSDLAPKASGRVYSGTRAQSLALTDREGGICTAYEELKRQIGIKQTERVQLEILPSVKEPLFGRSALPLGLSKLLAAADFSKAGIYALEARYMLL